MGVQDADAYQELLDRLELDGWEARLRPGVDLIDRIVPMAVMEDRR